MSESYHPELETSEFLNEEKSRLYRMIVRCLNWAVTLGRFDVLFAVSTLARYGISPCKGHLKEAIRALGYLKHHSKGHIVVDTRVP